MPVVQNWFILGAGVLYLAGTFVEIQAGRWGMALIFANYSVANFMLAVI